tara:strand:- start:2785 stop:3081 length:297 start_codon:yes stop_codon:yes gene_type:complete
MAYSYPIWNAITACIYQSGKSYGIKDTGENIIYVGSSASNSHKFLKTVITKRNIEDTIVFSFSVDDVIIKQMTFSKNKRGTADKLLKTKSKLNRLKSL